MKTRLLLIRHGNTFDKGDTILRVGSRTDIDLSNSGVEQAEKLGEFIKKYYGDLSEIFSSNLKRTFQTSKVISDILNKDDLVIKKVDFLNEIDYGEDDGKPDEEIIDRYGKEAMELWDKELIAPSKEWKVNIEEIIEDWRAFSEEILTNNEGETIAVVSSNGILRFSPHILGDTELFYQENNSKVSTGSISLLEHDGEKWVCDFWNKRL